MKDNKLTIIDGIVKLYSNGLLTCEESTAQAIQSINNTTWYIDDIENRLQVQNTLYKRFFSKMQKAIAANERKG